MTRTSLTTLSAWSFLIFLCLSLNSFGWAHPLDASTAAQSFRQSVSEMLSKKCASGIEAGIKIVSLESHNALVDINSRQSFIPASNMKVVTTAAALRKVGPDFRFHTRLYTQGQVKGRVLKGDLFVKGFGDPFLVTEQMWLLVNQLRQLPLDRIEGDVYVDDSYFEGGMKIATWDRYEGPEAYLAPLGALSFNFNTVAVHVAPSPKAGQPPVVVMDPQVPYLRLENSAVTVRRGRRGRLIVNRHGKHGHDVVTVSGTLPMSMARKTYYLNITDPAWYAGHVFLDYLKRTGVEITGGLHRGPVPEGIEPFLEHESLPLANVLEGLNKYSNNFIAEQILRTLAARDYGPPGTTENGVKILSDYLKSLGHPETEFVIADGSGLSRQNRLTPEQIISVLMDAHRDLGIFPEFIAALAIMGTDGSVNERMTSVQGAQKIRAKTGTLNNVSAISGYVQSADDEVFAFSILMNGLQCSNGRAHRLQEAILSEALRFTRKGEASQIDEEAGTP